MKHVLFVTWDGPGQTYLESLFLPIFREVSRWGYRFSVLQFRWGTKDQEEHAAAAARAAGVEYESVRILRRPKGLGALVSVACGAAHLRQMLAARAVDVVMPRSILPAQLVSLVRPTQPVVFDADGLPADERVEFAGWRSGGAYYRVWRDIEARALQTARAVITRTAASKAVLLSRAGAALAPDRIVVAPNGKDERAFTPGTAESRAAVRASNGIAADVPWVIFAGSIGPQYHPRELLRFYSLVRQRSPRARLTVLTGQTSAVRDLVREAGIEEADVQSLRVPPEDVPNYLAGGDLGIAFRQPSFSQLAVSPIKVAEYLLCGLPVLATRGVGDLDLQVPVEAGRLLGELDDSALSASADWFCSQVLPGREAHRDAARRAGLATFTLSQCAERYAKALSIALDASGFASARRSK